MREKSKHHIYLEILTYIPRYITKLPINLNSCYIFLSITDTVALIPVLCPCSFLPSGIPQYPINEVISNNIVHIRVFKHQVISSDNRLSRIRQLTVLSVDRSSGHLCTRCYIYLCLLFNYILIYFVLYLLSSPTKEYSDNSRY